MSITRIRNFILQKYKIVTTGNYTVVNESVVIVNKTSGAATGITLPPSVPITGATSKEAIGVRRLIVLDGKGDAGSNNITITAAGADTINGSATYVLSNNYGEVDLTDCGGGVWTASITLSGASLSTLTVTTETVTSETVTTTNATTANITNGNITNLVTNGFEIDSDVVSVNAAGTVIANATALTHAINIVAGANDAAGVVLPATALGKYVEVYNQDANGTHGLKIYPPVNSTINNGSANAAINIEGWTLARFRGLSATAWAAAYTVNA